MAQIEGGIGTSHLNDICTKLFAFTYKHGNDWAKLETVRLRSDRNHHCPRRLVWLQSPVFALCGRGPCPLPFRSVSKPMGFRAMGWPPRLLPDARCRRAAPAAVRSPSQGCHRLDESRRLPQGRRIEGSRRTPPPPHVGSEPPAALGLGGSSLQDVKEQRSPSFFFFAGRSPSGIELAFAELLLPLRIRCSPAQKRTVPAAGGCWRSALEVASRRIEGDSSILFCFLGEKKDKGKGFSVKQACGNPTLI